MFVHCDQIGDEYVKFELDANDFELNPGDTVAPGGEIGIDIRSGSPAYLDNWGKVATVYYNPMNHSYIVMIHRLKRTRYATNDSENKDFVMV